MVTTFGGWDNAAVKLVRELAKSKKAEPAHIFDSVSITIARSVSRLLRKALGPVRFVTGSRKLGTTSNKQFSTCKKHFSTSSKLFKGDSISVVPSGRMAGYKRVNPEINPTYPEQSKYDEPLVGFPAAAPAEPQIPAAERGIRAKAALQRSAVYQSARKQWERPIFSQEQRSQMAKPRKWLPPRSSQGSVRARVAELDSCPAKPIVPQSHRGAGAVLVNGGESESEYVEMDPYARKGKNRAWLARIKAEAGRKGPPVRVDEVVRPVGVVGEGCRSNTPGHEIRAGGVSVLPVSQCTPPQRVSRLSVFRGQFDELEYNDWKFEQGNYGLSSNRSNIMSDLSRSVHNIMSDARNQPEFSYFS